MTVSRAFSASVISLSATLLFVLVFLCAGCAGSSVSPPAGSGGSGGAGPPVITLNSPAFRNGAPIPRENSGEGADRSPALSWSGVPGGTRELALICDDPDAPSPKNPGPKPWVHWVAYGIPAGAKGLPADVGRGERLKNPSGAVHGRNSWPKDNIGYRGPLPPPGSGTHRYFFRLYALDAPLNLEPGAMRSEVLAAMRGHVIGRGELLGTYERAR